MFLVMLSGFAKSGKDEVASLLVERYGFRRFALADALKDEVAVVYGLPRASLNTQIGKEALFGDRKVRNILIGHGSMRRAEDLGYWVKSIIRGIEQSKADRIVVSDWRYANEFNLIQSHFTGATLARWRINRFETSPVDDASERQLDEVSFDFVISNRSSLEDLRAAVHVAARTLPLS